MKRIALSSALTICTLLTNAQDPYHSYFGIKLGMNEATNTISPKIDGLSTSYQAGFAGGIYYNFGLGEIFSIQTELLYSGMGSNVKYAPNNGNGEGTLLLDYISVPLLFKVTPVWRLGLFAGPQFDYLAGAISNTNSQASVDQMDNLLDYDVAGTAGIEFWITKNIGLFGRYIYGFNNINEFEGTNATLPINPAPNIKIDEIKNQAWQFGITIALRTKIKETETAPPLTITVDTDGDGIIDKNDQCPGESGVAKYLGCAVPDTDGDNINDEEDQCPDKAGIIKYLGCPIPDSDSDSINDEDDKCPTQAGLARYNGCPIPDTDTDGINDENDKCPDLAGIADNLGCPELTLYYKRDQATLTSEDKTNVDRVIKFLNDNPSLSISIQSHTSTTGKTEYNQKLSEQRATATMNYLIYKGINKNRLSVIGFGEQFPVGDNNTPEGRAQSRRTVIRVQK